MPSVTKAVLFDLDGTLADTAGDLGGALNALLLEQGRQPLPLQKLRPFVSAGARGLLNVGFGITPDDPLYATYQPRFLELYQDALCVHTRLFDGMAEHLEKLEGRGLVWGIVTNKSTRFAVPLMEALNLHQRSACIVCGDSAARPKPHPDPMLLASSIVGIAPEHCIYVGDDERDIVAGRAAGMRTIAAAWGYLGNDKPPTEWGADAIANKPADILEFITATD